MGSEDFWNQRALARSSSDSGLISSLATVATENEVWIGQRAQP